MNNVGTFVKKVNEDIKSVNVAAYQITPEVITAYAQQDFVYLGVHTEVDEMKFAKIDRNISRTVRYLYEELKERIKAHLTNTLPSYVEVVSWDHYDDIVYIKLAHIDGGSLSNCLAFQVNAATDVEFATCYDKYFNEPVDFSKHYKLSIYDHRLCEAYTDLQVEILDEFGYMRMEMQKFNQKAIELQLKANEAESRIETIKGQRITAFKGIFGETLSELNYTRKASIQDALDVNQITWVSVQDHLTVQENLKRIKKTLLDV